MPVDTTSSSSTFDPLDFRSHVFGEDFSSIGANDWAETLEFLFDVINEEQVKTSEVEDEINKEEPMTVGFDQKLVDAEFGEPPRIKVSGLVSFEILVKCHHPEECKTITHDLKHNLEKQIAIAMASKENVLACGKVKRGPQRCSKCGELRKGHVCQKKWSVKASRRSKTSPNQSHRMHRGLTRSASVAAKGHAAPHTMNKAPIKACHCPTPSQKPSLK